LRELHQLTILDTKTFNKAVKKLKKKFRNIEKDCLLFIDSIKTDEDLGVYLGKGIYKTRITNSDKSSGKSSGYRLISYFKIIDNELYLMFIYDKSEFENVSESDLDQLLLASLD
jgi:hypothetical protein